MKFACGSPGSQATAVSFRPSEGSRSTPIDAKLRAPPVFQYQYEIENFMHLRVKITRIPRVSGKAIPLHLPNRNNRT